MSLKKLKAINVAKMPNKQYNEFDSINEKTQSTCNKTENNIFHNRYRFFILILCLLCLGSIFSNMTTINFTLICMDPLSDINNHNQSDSIKHPTHSYTQYQKTILQWAVSISSMISTFPISWICTKYGARYTFFVSGILSGISTGLIPIAAKHSFNYFVGTRLLQGFAYACDFAVVGVLCTRWAPLTENAKFIAVLTCFSSISSFVSNSFMGIICESSLGWPWVHYSHAIVSIILFTLWVIFYTDDPLKNRFITSNELNIIHCGKTEAHKTHEPYVPYLAIAKDKVVWAVWINAFADLFSSFFLYIYAPTYIKNVLNYSMTKTGLYNALGAVSHIPVKMTCGYISDTYYCVPERQKMWFFNSVALLAPALIYIYLCFSPDPLIVVILFGGVHAALGFNCGGFYKCGALVARQYAEFVIAFTQFIKCAVFFVAPALVTIFIYDDRNASQWHIIFYIIIATLIIANVIFCINATDQPRPFTQITSKNKRNQISELKNVI